MARYVLALDQGTTSSRAILFNQQGLPVAAEQFEFTQHFPYPGWVEHDPEEIWQSQLRVARRVIEKARASSEDVAALGIANQRETTVIWERSTGSPIYRAIVWQSRQTSSICDRLRSLGLEEEIGRRTGLVVDPYFSATKIRFILDAIPGAQQRAERGELAFGTVDTWLLYRLTGGRVHATECANASRTMLYNIVERAWDERLLEMLSIPPALLPEVQESCSFFGETDPTVIGATWPITGVAGDQQAALFGQGCWESGRAKNTYGTGCFFLVNTGSQMVRSRSGLVSTVACSSSSNTRYALEGSVFTAGSAVQWLRDGLGLIKHVGDSERAALSVSNTEGMYLVPAFVGLGAPHWDPQARGALVGITGGTRREHVIRATLESIAYQTRDVIDCVHRDSALELSTLSVDGGACRNDFLMQFQADILGIPIRRPRMLEVTAFGAAALAGLQVGFWHNADELISLGREGERSFEPILSGDEREALYQGWRRAVERSRDWATP